MDMLPDDMQWQLYVLIILVVVVLLAFLFYINVPFKRDVKGVTTKVLAITVLLIGLYDILDYSAATFVDNYEKYRAALDYG